MKPIPVEDEFPLCKECPYRWMKLRVESDDTGEKSYIAFCEHLRTCKRIFDLLRGRTDWC